jgi:excisionase family DNA binding protein
VSRPLESVEACICTGEIENKERDMNEPTGDWLRSRVEAADKLGIGLSTLDGLVSEGRLKSIRIRRRRLIADSAIADFLKEEAAR